MRIEDALNATKAAVEEGVVPGGGVALLSVAKDVKAFAETLKGDERTGAMIVVKSLQAPVKQIAENAGVDGSVVVNEVLVRGAENRNVGYDAYNDCYIDMVEGGIVDPTKVTRSALMNAASVAATLLTTESLVCDIPAPEPQAPAGGGMGGMGGMY